MSNSPHVRNDSGDVVNMEQNFTQFATQFLLDHDGCWISHSVEEEDGTLSTYYVLIRPYAKEFLIQCSQHYDIVFFTAGSRDYAEPILDKLWPGVRKRYYREDCFVDDNVYMKDLSKLQDLAFDRKRVFLFDDNAPDNTLPPSNGMFCCQFAPDNELDDSHEAIERLQLDTSLQAFAQLFSNPIFKDADDVREPIARYSSLIAQKLSSSEDSEKQAP